MVTFGTTGDVRRVACLAWEGDHKNQVAGITPNRSVSLCGNLRSFLARAAQLTYNDRQFTVTQHRSVLFIRFWLPAELGMNAQDGTSKHVKEL
jgi:hypothetical protein